MKDDLAVKLKGKGWSEEEIRKVTHIIDDIEKKKPQSGVTFGKIVYWTGLLVAIIGNLVMSVVLIPFIIVMKETQLYIVIGLLALGFGFLFNLLIKDIEGLDENHHIIAGIFIPAIAIINVYIMSFLANHFVQITGFTEQRNPLIISIVYVAAFMIPYLVSVIKGKIRKSQANNTLKEEVRHELEM